MFNKIKEKKGGFTLVELIIVLVILAVLAAFLVPTLTGYVRKADDKSLISEARLAVMAAQTYADELYAADRKVEQSEIADLYDEIIKLAELPDTATITVKCEEATGKVTDLTYKATDTGKTCTYDHDSTGDKYSVN